MEREALVIGIPEYDNFSSLPKTTIDAEAVATLLEKYGGFRVERLPKKLNPDKTGQTTKADKVTYKQLATALKAFIQRANNKYALIYFTGHGFTEQSLLGRTRGFLCPSDCSIKHNDEGIISSQVNGLDFEELNHSLEQAQFSQLVLLLDCCHSGYFIERYQVENGLKTFLGSKDFYLITACLSSETAKAIISKENSVFSGAVIRGLSQENQDHDGKISASRLFDFIQRELKSRLQEPLHLGSGSSINLLTYGNIESSTPVILDGNGEPQCPYRGLSPFEVEHEKFYFGRRAEVQEIIQKLYCFSFVSIIGASGSGKSSLVKAGLIPHLEDEWHILNSIKPDARPIVNLGQAIGSLFELSCDRKQIIELLEKDGISPVLEMLSKTTLMNSGKQKILLVIDQFEEVFTICVSGKERSQFIECMAAVKAHDNSPLSIVMTIRSEFTHDLFQVYNNLFQRNKDSILWLGQLQGEDLREAIKLPAMNQGYTLEAGLMELLVNDVQAEMNFLPLLEFALTELWDRREKARKELPLRTYMDMNRLSGALDKRAEDVYNDALRTEDERSWIKRIFLELVRFGIQGIDTRERKTRKSLIAMGPTPTEQSVIDKVIEVLIQGRLLASTNEHEIDLVHETLMSGWKRFSKWRKENREDKLLVQQLGDAVTEWQREGDSFLLQGGG